MAKTTYEDRTLAVSLTDAKTYLRLTHTSDDTVITTLIRAAMAFVENYIDTSFTDDSDHDGISDFFNNELMASKWTPAGVVSESDHPGALVVESSSVELDNMSGAWQRVTGDFDVRAHLRLPSGLGVSSGATIVAKMDDDNGMSARYQRNAAGAYFISRNDEVETTKAETTSAFATVTDMYLRLRRSGGRFFAYGKRWNTDAWTAIAAPATELLTSGPVELWLSAYHGGGAIEAWWDWIVENSEYASFPLPWCYGGSASGSGHRLWGECGEPIVCNPMWVHPCTGETELIPYPVQQAIMQLVRRMYDNRGGLREEEVADWVGTWMDMHESDIVMLLEQYRNVGI